MPRKIFEQYLAKLWLVVHNNKAGASGHTRLTSIDGIGERIRLDGVHDKSPGQRGMISDPRRQAALKWLDTTWGGYEH